GAALAAPGRTRLPEAAVVREVTEQRVHMCQLRAVVHVPALALDAHQVGMDEFLQMEGQGRARDVEHRGQRARRQALGAGADQRPEDAQAGLLGQGRESYDSGFLIHNSKSIEIWN